MSLTSLLKDSSTRSELQGLFPKPKLPDATKPDLLVPPAQNPQKAGTAFDYLLRFELGRLHPHAKKRGWVALTVKKYLEAGMLAIDPTLVSGALAGVTKKVRAAEKAVADYESGKPNLKQVCGAALDLASIDPMWRNQFRALRAGIPWDDDVRHDPAMIDELMRLIKVVPSEVTGPHKAVWLNPTFGKWSVRIGGADADLVLNRTLVDVKTKKDATFGNEEWLQLVGYALLADMARQESKGVPAIDQVGIYLSRHGVLRAWSIAALRKSPNWSKGQRVLSDAVPKTLNRKAR